MSTPAPPTQSIGIGPKFVLVTVGVSVFTAILLSLVAAQRLRSSLLDSTVSEGRAVAIGFAVAAERLPTTCTPALQPLLDSFRDAGSVEYLFVVDNANSVLAHTFRGQVPPELGTLNPVPVGSLSSGERVKAQPMTEVTIEGNPVTVTDVAIPLSGGVKGVLHVGMKHESVGASGRRLDRPRLAVPLRLPPALRAGAALRPHRLPRRRGPALSGSPNRGFVAR